MLAILEVSKTTIRDVDPEAVMGNEARNCRRCEEEGGCAGMCPGHPRYCKKMSRREVLCLYHAYRTKRPPREPVIIPS